MKSMFYITHWMVIEICSKCCYLHFYPFFVNSRSCCGLASFGCVPTYIIVHFRCIMCAFRLVWNPKLPFKVKQPEYHKLYLREILTQTSGRFNSGATLGKYVKQSKPNNTTKIIRFIPT